MGVVFCDFHHAYFLDGKKVALSVTGVLQATGFIDLSQIPAERLKQKRILGKTIHRASEWIETGVGIDWESLPDHYVPYLSAHLAAVESMKPEVGTIGGNPGIEYAGVGALGGMWCGFMIDRAYFINGKPYIVDLKCTATESESWEKQTAGYAQLCPPMDGQKEPYGRMVWWLLPTGKYKVLTYDNNAADYSAFRSALHCASLHVAEGRLKPPHREWREGCVCPDLKVTK